MNTMNSDARADYSTFAVEALQVLNNISDKYLEEFDVHWAFDYWIAELYENTNSDSFAFTDGANDRSIDFAIRGMQSYSVYQCKCPDADQLEEGAPVRKYDAGTVNELIEAVRYMLDSSSYLKAKACVRDLRSSYQLDREADPDSTRLEATLAVFGELTPSARQSFEAAKQEYFEDGVILNCIEWMDIRERAESLANPSYDDVSISLTVDSFVSDVLHRNDWIYALAYAKDLVDAVDEFGVRLFDLNVRHEIPSSSVNKEIVKSVQHSKTRRIFHHLNNGLLVTCNSFTKKPPSRILIKGAQIVNGCQTVSSLAHAYKGLPPKEQLDFGSDVRVQVKVIQNAKPDLLEQIVISTNNQNPMKPRNLKSNSSEQKSIQHGFNSLSPRWFYVRKDGEFESLCAAGKRAPGFRRSDYSAELPSGMHRRDRMVDNIRIAKAWYAWIGNSHSVLQGGQDYFGNNTLYERVFRKRPNEEFWRMFAYADFEGAAKTPMEEGSPSPLQYLLATACASYLKTTSISSYTNKKESLQKGLQSKVLKGNSETGVVTSNAADQAAWLAKDTDYMLKTYLINMEDVLVELMSFTLTQKYGPLLPATCMSILRQPDFDAWNRSAFMIPADTLASAYPNGTLVRLTEFVRWTAKNYCAQSKAQIDASPRAKMFFAKRETVKAMREKLMEDNDLSAYSSTFWKPEPGAKFLDTLPPLF